MMKAADEGTLDRNFSVIRINRRTRQFTVITGWDEKTWTSAKHFSVINALIPVCESKKLEEVGLTTEFE